MRLLEAAGYSVTRAAASLGAWDLVGIGSTDVVLVQVKTRDYPGALERSKLAQQHRELIGAADQRAFPGPTKVRHRTPSVQ